MHHLGGEERGGSAYQTRSCYSNSVVDKSVEQKYTADDVNKVKKNRAGRVRGEPGQMQLLSFGSTYMTLFGYRKPRLILAAVYILFPMEHYCAPALNLFS